MKNKTQTLVISEKLTSLEENLFEKFLEKENLEKKLSDAYASGVSADSFLKKLSECRDSITGMIAALKQMDLKLFEVQAFEHKDLSEALDRKMQKDFQMALRATIKGIKPLERVLLEIIPKDSIPALSDNLLEVIKIEIWNTLQIEADKDFLKIPPYPKTPLERNAKGLKFEKPVHMLGRA